MADRNKSTTEQQVEGCLLFEENIFSIILNNSRIVEEIVKRLQVHQDDKRETEII